MRIAATLESVETINAPVPHSSPQTRSVTSTTNTTGTTSTTGTAGARVTPAPARPLSQDEGAKFTSLVDSLIPCRNEDPELWFAEQAPIMAVAKALCAQCPIAASCLAGALERAEPWGVWGGEIIVDGAVVAQKRGRGRPRKVEVQG